MKPLFLTYCYPPLGYPRSIQIARLVKHLETPPALVCAAGRRGEPDDPSIDDGAGMRADPLTRLEEPWWRQWLFRWRDLLLPRHWALPDPNRQWSQNAAAQVIEALPELGADLLVTFGQPMSVHLAGLRIKEATGLPWIAHFSDPWADNPFADHGGYQDWIVRRMEHAVMAAADRVLFTSEETRRLVMKKYRPEWEAKALVLPHAFDAARFPAPRPRAPGQPVVIRYLGNFYGPRGPGPLFRLLEKLTVHNPALLAGTRVEFYGDFSPSAFMRAGFQSLTSGLVSIHKRVDYAASLALMGEADLLLVLDAPAAQSVFLPSKLVDYIGAGRPIFGLTPPGTSADLIRRLGGWSADPDDMAAGASALAAAIEAVRERDGDQIWGCAETRAEFEAKTVARRMTAIMAEVVGVGSGSD